MGRGNRGGREEDRETLYGVHPVAEALTARSRSIERVFVAAGASGGRIGRLLREARAAGVPVSHLPREVLARKIGARAVHQGIAAVVSAVPFEDTDELCRRAASREDGLLVLLDRVVDPGNLGAALRAAAGAGAQGVLLASDHTVGLTPAVARASAGALERIPVARDPRPGPRLRSLREAGFRVVGLDPRAVRPWYRADLRGRVVLVAGGEERGVRPGVAAECNASVALPLAPGVESLNVATALGILLFEAVRQRRGSGAGGPKDQGFSEGDLERSGNRC